MVTKVNHGGSRPMVINLGEVFYFLFFPKRHLAMLKDIFYCLKEVGEVLVLPSKGRG